MAGINSANQLGYVALESVFGTAVPPTNTNAFRMANLREDPNQARLERPDKNGSLSVTRGVAGIRTATWSTRLSVAPNGTAGIAPDIGPFLQAAMGKAPVVAAGASVTYALDDLQPSLSIWSYWKPAAASQQVAIGAVVAQMIIDVAGDFAMIELSGPALWVNDTEQFPTADPIALGGLATFPTEPALPVTNGNALSIFAGSAVLAGQPVLEIRTFRLTANFNRDLPQDIIWNGRYAAGPGQDRRNISFDMNVYDKAGDVNFSALKVQAINKVPVDCVFTLGDVAGNRCVITLNDVELGTPQQDDGQRRKAVTFNGSAAVATSGTAKDEMVIAFT